MKVFLLGATGAIGKLLTPQLVNAGYEVIGTTRSAGKTEAIALAGARPLVLNAMDRVALFAALRAEQPQVLINMLTDLAGLDYAANSRLRSEGSRNIADAARAAGVTRLVAESIGWMYGAGDQPAREDEPLDMDASESRGRAVAAVQALEGSTAELPYWIVLRYGILYGPGTWYVRDEQTTEEIRRGEIEANDAVTSFIHVADAAQAAFQAIDWPNGAYNIVDDEPAPASAWVPYYAQLVGASPPPYKPGRKAWERGATNAKAKALGWHPEYPSWREGFRAVLA